MMEHDTGLSPAERSALLEWARGDVPSDFGERVMLALEPPAARGSAGSGSSWSWSGSGSGWLAVFGAVAAVVLAWLALTVGLTLRSGDHAGRPADGDLASVRSLATPPTDEAMAASRAMSPDDARALLRAHCLPCHEGGGQGAEASALRVFDLSSRDWVAALSNQELSSVRDKFVSLAVVGPDQRRGMATFVDDELRQRRRRGG